MRIGVEVKNCTVMATKSTKSKDGTKDYYSLAIFTASQDAGMISCDENVAKMNIAPMTKGTLVCEFNDQYGSFRCIGFRADNK